MSDTSHVRDFTYRAPRVAFPLSFRLEMLKPNACLPIGICGIDVSVDGIAVEICDSVALHEPVELVIRSEAHGAMRIPGRAYYQSNSHFGFVFEFANEDQREQIQRLMSQLVTTV